MESVAIIGSNFGVKGYLPALKKNKNYKISLICCKSNKTYLELSKKFPKIKISKNWKEAFNKNIDTIICSTIPKVQEKIINYNFIKKKKLFLKSQYQIIIKKVTKY